MPRPQKHVFVCVQQRPPGHPRSSCAERDCASVYEEFMIQWQQRDLMGKVMVTNAGCMGPCHAGPTVLVYPEGVMYSGVTAEDVGTIIDDHLLGDTPVERLKADPMFWS